MHIKDSIYKARRFTTGMTYEDFRDDDRRDYEDVRQRLVWGVVKERFPALLSVVEQELANDGGGDSARPDDT